MGNKTRHRQDESAAGLVLLTLWIWVLYVGMLLFRR